MYAVPSTSMQDNQTVSEVLDQMFKGTDIKYVMEGQKHSF